jgi:hypothetical protein
MHRVTTRKLNPLQRQLVKDAVSFVCKKFMPRMNLEIMIKGIEDLLDKDGTYGDCIWQDDNYRPREFLIRIDNTLPIRTFLETLMHELTHVKQYAKGELGWLSREDITTWQGQRVSRKISYYDYPWEIEARGREYGLTEEFLNTHSKWEKYVKEGFTNYKMLGSSQMVLPFSR